MAVLITVSSILIITAVVAALNRFLPFPLCPICSGVSATWLFLTAFVIAGFLEREAFMPLVLLLMGGTVVGISYQGERALVYLFSRGRRLSPGRAGEKKRAHR